MGSTESFNDFSALLPKLICRASLLPPQCFFVLLLIVIFHRYCIPIGNNFNAFVGSSLGKLFGKYMPGRLLKIIFLFLQASSCNNPGTPLNGYKSSTSYNHGSAITFSCKAGFSLYGSASRTCSNGQWSGTKAECKGTHHKFLMSAIRSLCLTVF